MSTHLAGRSDRSSYQGSFKKELSHHEIAPHVELRRFLPWLERMFQNPIENQQSIYTNKPKQIIHLARTHKEGSLHKPDKDTEVLGSFLA